jgi:hypothetical protein
MNRNRLHAEIQAAEWHQADALLLKTRVCFTFPPTVPPKVWSEQTDLHGRQHVLHHHNNCKDVDGPQQPLSLRCLPKLAFQVPWGDAQEHINGCLRAAACPVVAAAVEAAAALLRHGPALLLLLCGSREQALPLLLLAHPELHNNGGWMKADVQQTHVVAAGQRQITDLICLLCVNVRQRERMRLFPAVEEHNSELDCSAMRRTRSISTRMDTDPEPSAFEASARWAFVCELYLF